MSNLSASARAAFFFPAAYSHRSNSWNAGARRSTFSSSPALRLAAYTASRKQTLLDVTTRYAADRGELDRAR